MPLYDDFAGDEIGIDEMSDDLNGPETDPRDDGDEFPDDDLYPCEGPEPRDDDEALDPMGFQDPGGKSALRAATPTNPRNLPCPTCERPNVLTPRDAALGYQCDRCADAAEGGGP